MIVEATKRVYGTTAVRAPRRRFRPIAVPVGEPALGRSGTAAKEEHRPLGK
jgi:hypothetical protein